MPLHPRLRVGVQLPEVEREVRWPEYASMARAAEAHGFDSLWIGDHFLYRNDGRTERGPWEAWTLLTALAGATSTVDLGPLVSCLLFHPPAVIAKMAATIDEVSNGRLVLGVGAGWNRTEFDAFGIPFDNRASRFEESFDIVSELVSGRRVTKHGRFYSADDAVLLPAPARPIPIMVGSYGERVLRHALPKATWWNTWFDWFGNTPEGFAAMNERISKICDDIDMEKANVKRSACVLVNVDPTAQERPQPDGYDAVKLDRLATTLDAMHEAGAHEVILVLNPINERSIVEVARALQST